MILTESSSRIYIFFWAIISIYELYLIITILFRLAGWGYSGLAIIIPVLPIIVAVYLTIEYKSYQPINTIDFYNSLILGLGCCIIIWILLIRKCFIENIEIFFIFSGFIMYFGLHILSTNIMAFDFLKHWFFAQNSTLIALVYWLGSIVCIRKIRYKYSY